MDEIERLELRIRGIARGDRAQPQAQARRPRVSRDRASLIVGFVLGPVDYSPTRVVVAFALAIGGMV
jgi:hypothetical protein